MRDKFYTFVGESDTDGFWTTAKVNSLIKSGVREFARKSRCIEGCWSRDIEAGKNRYSAPSEMLQGSLRYVQFEAPGKDPERMEFLEERRFQLEYAAQSYGVPNTYSIWEHCIFLGPTPQWHVETAMKVFVEGTAVYIRMPSGTTHSLGVSPINILGEQLCTLSVVTAVSVSLTGDNRLIVNLPDDNFLVIATTTTAVGGASLQLSVSSIKAKYSDGTYSAEIQAASVDSWHGTIHIHGYRDPEPFVDDEDGCEIFDEYADGPVLYALYAGLRSDRRYAESIPFKHDFDSMVLEANLWARKHQSDQRNGVTTGREELGRAPTHRRAF
jgi:hypothetical protein